MTKGIIRPTLVSTYRETGSPVWSILQCFFGIVTLLVISVSFITTYIFESRKSQKIECVVGEIMKDSCECTDKYHILLFDGKQYCVHDSIKFCNSKNYVFKKEGQKCEQPCDLNNSNADLNQCKCNDGYEQITDDENEDKKICVNDKAHYCESKGKKYDEPSNKCLTKPKGNSCSDGTKIQIDDDGKLTCVKDPIQTCKLRSKVYDSDRNRCSKCPEDFVVKDNTCQCRTGLTKMWSQETSPKTFCHPDPNAYCRDFGRKYNPDISRCGDCLDGMLADGNKCKCPENQKRIDDPKTKTSQCVIESVATCAVKKMIYDFSAHKCIDCPKGSELAGNYKNVCTCMSSYFEVTLNRSKYCVMDPVEFCFKNRMIYITLNRDCQECPKGTHLDQTYKCMTDATSPKKSENETNALQIKNSETDSESTGFEQKEEKSSTYATIIIIIAIFAVLIFIGLIISAIFYTLKSKRRRRNNICDNDNDNDYNKNNNNKNNKNTISTAHKAGNHGKKNGAKHHNNRKYGKHHQKKDIESSDYGNVCNDDVNDDVYSSNKLNDADYSLPQLNADVEQSYSSSSSSSSSPSLSQLPSRPSREGNLHNQQSQAINSNTDNNNSNKSNGITKRKLKAGNKKPRANMDSL